MEKEQLVIQPSTALALKAAGLVLPSCFSYYRLDDKLKVELTANRDGSFVAYAYTASELMDILPGGLEVDQNTYVATNGGWVYLTEKGLNYPYAHLTMVKTPGGGFVTAYYHSKRNIAFRNGEDGKAVNLLRIEDSFAESLAQMVLALLEEGKIASFL